MNLREITLEPVAASEERRFQSLMQAYHYLGSLPKIGHTLWYVATWHRQWLALLSFSAAAWKCAARDSWIGWDFRHQYDRLHLIANNSRFLILPEHHYPNLASRVLSLCERRLAQDWPARFGHPLWLLETFVDPRHFHGTIYRAANWVYAGDTRGFRRTRKGYSATAQAPKRVFLRPLVPHAQARLSCPILDPTYCHGAPKLMLSAEHMRSLPAFFADIPDPRRAQGRRHHLPVVLAIATAAVLCGARGYKAISEWADFREPLTLAHGRLESRAIWITTRLNDYLDFPGVGQAFAIERQTIEKKTGKVSTETVYGLTSHTPESADAARLLAFNRDHWGVESHHYILDWNWDEDRCTVRTGHGPENITRLRRFATGLIKSKSRDSVAATIRKLARNVRHVFDYLRLTGNSIPRSQISFAHAG